MFDYKFQKIWLGVVVFVAICAYFVFLYFGGFVDRFYLYLGNKNFREGNYTAALGHYGNVQNLGEEYEDGILLNESMAEYHLGNFDDSRNKLKKLLNEKCVENTPECALYYYNMGNSNYRIGENLEDREGIREYWTKSVSNYEKVLETMPEDSDAQENLEFVKSKLNELEPQMQNGESENSQNSDDSSDSNSSDSKENGELESNSGKEGESGEGENTPRLSEDMDRQVEEYLEQMEKNQENLQNHLNRFGEEEGEQDSMDDFFSDPFFDDFFGGDPFDRRNLREEREGEEKDW